VKKQKFLDVIALAVNVIEILESEETTFFKQHFLDVIQSQSLLLRFCFHINHHTNDCKNEKKFFLVKYVYLLSHYRALNNKQTTITCNSFSIFLKVKSCTAFRIDYCS